MSELDDLEEIAGSVRCDRELSRRSITAGNNFRRAFKKGSATIQAKADAGKLVLSTYQPSLPKLKFMEGS